MPRNVDRDVAERDHVTVLDLDDLSAWADRALVAAGRRDGRRCATSSTTSWSVASSSRRPARRRRSSPSCTIAAEQVRAAEVARFSRRLAALDDAQRAEVEALTRAIVAKLLHEPSVRLRHDAGTPQGERNAAAVSDLFEL